MSFGLHEYLGTVRSQGHFAALFLIDLAKAFDSVNHEILLFKLTQVIFLDWLSSYLTGRSAFTCVAGHSSPGLPLSLGVPQGSILGPLLIFASC